MPFWPNPAKAITPTPRRQCSLRTWCYHKETSSNNKEWVALQISENISGVLDIVILLRLDPAKAVNPFMRSQGSRNACQCYGHCPRVLCLSAHTQIHHMIQNPAPTALTVPLTPCTRVSQAGSDYPRHFKCMLKKDLQEQQDKHAQQSEMASS